MSPADSADRPGPLRVTYGAELEQLRLQVEVMGVLVDQNLDYKAGDAVSRPIVVWDTP